MNERKPSPEFENLLRNVIAAPAPEADFVKALGDRLEQEANAKSRISFGVNLRWAWGIAIALIVLAVGLLTVTPQGAAGMQRLLGYIPGLGLVEQGVMLRILEQPVTSKRDAVQLTVEQGVIDAEKTAILVRVEGLYNAPDPLTDDVQFCRQMPQLVLPDGETLMIEAAEGYGWESGYTQRMQFPSIPIDVYDVALELPCLQIVPGDWPTDWRIPLRFIQARDSDLVPVIELPGTPTPEPMEATPIGEATQESGSEQAEATASPDTGGEISGSKFDISISVDQYAELEDGYVLMGSVNWSDDDIREYGVMIDKLHIIDANGEVVNSSEVSPNQWPAPEEKRSAWAYQIEGKDHAWPLTVVLDSVLVQIITPEPLSFQFDPGPNPQVDQSWELNLDIPVADDILTIKSARAMPGFFGNDSVGYEFTMESKGSVVGAMLVDQEEPPMGGGGGGGGGPGGGTFVGSVQYQRAQLPGGPRTIRLENLTLIKFGPWRVSWSPDRP